MNQPRSLRKAVIGVFLAIVTIMLLASVVMQVIGPRGSVPSIVQAKVERASLVTATKAYVVAYEALPISTNIQPSSNSDFTFGTLGTSARTVITNLGGYQCNNAELISILSDSTKYRNGKDTPNVDHAQNLRRHVFLNALQVADTKSHGIGLDGVYRDPWGNPYIITIDLDGNGRCRDGFYRLASVSERDSGPDGLNGLVRLGLPPKKPAELRDSFEAKGEVIVWSFGPDGKADSSKKANEGVNKDNVLSWQ